MKREPALVSLSHDHQHALAVALQLKRAETGGLQEAVAAFAAFWHAEGQAHFRAEEEILLPAFAARGDAAHPLVAQTLCDHVAIRAMAAGLDREPSLAGARELGARLADHVRLEERELFPLVERTLEPDELAALGEALP